MPKDMKEPGALEVPDKQEARVEAANALLFLQGQGSSTVDGPSRGERPEKEEPEAAAEKSGSSSFSTDEDDGRDEAPERDRKKGKFAQMPDISINFDDILKALKKENRALRESVEKMSLSESAFRNDAEKVRFYTGLPNYFVLETVMWLLAPHMDGMKNVKLSKFQQLLLTLMRLRLDLRNQDLAYRFGVKAGTVARTVHRMVNIMSSTLVPTAVFWPSRAELRKEPAGGPASVPPRLRRHRGLLHRPPGGARLGGGGAGRAALRGHGAGLQLIKVSDRRGAAGRGHLRVAGRARERQRQEPGRGLRLPVQAAPRRRRAVLPRPGHRGVCGGPRSSAQHNGRLQGRR
ncbi:uncharacterized protein LOC105938369 isoform X2 [Fundulus heteroclitus]|uniref:uncharacterized protein LOC105938369 isoform X2 n=1 Tax=Fundulus heteroclitus TaxID=8078 RepID=UPI00165C6EA1|nr:uncharacterized protein LOC105938369 isoform X2 [Fundulus heteroclitus]